MRSRYSAMTIVIDVVDARPYVKYAIVASVWGV